MPEAQEVPLSTLGAWKSDLVGRGTFPLRICLSHSRCERPEATAGLGSRGGDPSPPPLPAGRAPPSAPCVTHAPRAPGDTKSARHSVFRVLLTGYLT